MMKGQKIFAFFLVLIILGGLGFIVWSMIFMPGGIGLRLLPHTEMDPNNNHNNMNMGDKTKDQQQTSLKLNSEAAQNKDALSQAITTLNEAIDLITIDPYSRTTVPNQVINGIIGNAQTGRGTGTINIYPEGNSSVNISPSLNNNPGEQQSPLRTDEESNFVFDQKKLAQLHSRIYMLAQGMTLINELNEDISNQAGMMELSPPDYQTFVNRYNLAVQNKVKLTNGLSILNQAFSIINLNPYAPPNGFQYSVPNMEQLHNGIYKLSQAITQLTKLNEALTRQMAEAAIQAQMMMPASSMSGHGVGLSQSTLYNLLLLLAIIALILIMFGVVRKVYQTSENRRVVTEDNAEEGAD